MISLKQYLTEDKDEFKAKFSNNPDTLHKLAIKHNSVPRIGNNPMIHSHISHNPNTSADTLHMMAKDSNTNAHAKLSIVKHPNVRKDTLRHLAHDHMNDYVAMRAKEEHAKKV